MDKNSKKKELALRSSAAEYLTFVASTGGSDGPNSTLCSRSKFVYIIANTMNVKQ